MRMGSNHSLVILATHELPDFTFLFVKPWMITGWFSNNYRRENACLYREEATLYSAIAMQGINSPLPHDAEFLWPPGDLHRDGAAKQVCKEEV